jgi:APA family basic amino acid/polyamine antiporter
MSREHVLPTVLGLRRDRVKHGHFHTLTFLAVLGAICRAFLAGPWTGRDPVQYMIAGVLIGIGVVLWVVTLAINRATGVKPTEPAIEIGGPGPVN